MPAPDAPATEQATNVRDAMGAWVKDQLESPNFRLRDTHFEIRKLLAPEALEVLEAVREGLKGELQINTGSVELALASFVRPILGLPRSTVAEIRTRIFAQVYFRNKTAKTLRRVGDDVGHAFDGLEPFHIYEVLGRALIVNFRGSFADATSRFAAAMQDISPPAQPT